MRLLHLTFLLPQAYASHFRHASRYASQPSATDYVIVGAGPAGYVLASRLSKDPTVSVTLLEAGPDGSHDASVYTPAFSGNLAGTRYSWNYTSQPDSRRGGIAPSLAQGHCLGGGTSINFMEYCRGAASVYDEWANVSGIAGLKFNELLTQFELSTNLTIPSSLDYPEAANPDVYGSGPLQVSYEYKAAGTEPYWGDAVTDSIGQSVPIIDPTDGHAIGRVNGGPHTIDLETGRRSSAQTAYAATIADRTNVKVITGAEVTKINFKAKKAISVNYFSRTTSTNESIAANKEIILSAGAIGSPKLLMLSGIGPRKQLQTLGISVLKDVPELGNNLRDHQNAVIMVQIPESIVTTETLTDNTTLLADATAQFQSNGTGPLSELLSSSFVTERPSDNLLDSINATFHKALPDDRPLLLYQYVTAAMVDNPRNDNVISSFVSLVQPEGHGSMELASAHYRDAPRIYSNYWGSDADLSLMLYGYKKLRRAMKSEDIAPIVEGESYPGDTVQSDTALIKAMEESAWSFHHPVGTCSLGKVLDSNFRIPGVSGLRVIDSSALPYIPTCHIQASVYAVAELAAKMIQEG